ncbi:MAG: hypothetical protein II133_00315 [Lachnospiraceae bacterium]|nr:hypothetical protein [Lachnospiraceae bacterium]
MILKDLIFCRRIKYDSSDDNRKQINADGIMTALTPDVANGKYSFSVLFTITGMDLGTNHEIHLCIHDLEENEILQSEEIDVPAVAEHIRSSDVRPVEYQDTGFSMDFRNVRFTGSGNYKVIVMVDGNSIGAKEVYVIGSDSDRPEG